MSLRVFALPLLLTLISLSGVSAYAQQTEVERAQEAARQAQNAAQEASNSQNTQAAVSGETRVETTTTQTTVTTDTSTTVTDLEGSDCQNLTRQFQNQFDNYTRTLEVINPLLTKFEIYVDESLAVARQSQELIETYTRYNFQKVEFETTGIQVNTEYRLLSEIDCQNDPDLYRAELQSVLDLQTEQADEYTQLLQDLETTYTVTL